MRRMGGHVVCLAMGLALLTSLNGPCFAQDYPTRPIHLIVPFAAGGGADAGARVVAQRISGPLGQQVVVENRGGAAAIVGTEFVAKAKPDGYTLLLGQSVRSQSILEFTYTALRSVRSFAPITLTTSYPYILVVNSRLPVKSVHDLVGLARTKQGALAYGSAGNGGANHLVTEMFDSMAGISDGARA